MRATRKYRTVLFVVLAVLLSCMPAPAGSDETGVLISKISRTEGEGKYPPSLELMQIYLKNSPKKAVKLGKETLRLFLKYPDIRYQAKLLNKLSLAVLLTGDFPESRTYGEQALRIAQKNGFTTEEALSYDYIGRSFWNMGDLENALANFNRSLSVYRSIGDRYKEALILNLMAGVFVESGNYPLALDTYLKCIGILDEFKEDRIIYKVRMNLAIIYRELNSPIAGMAQIDKSLKTAVLLKDKYMQGVLYLQKGMLFMDQKKYRQAMDSYDKSIQVYEELGNISRMGRMFTYKAEVATQLKEYDEAEKYLRKSVLLLTRSNSKGWLSKSHRIYAVLFRDRGDLDMSFSHGQKALGYSRESGIRKEVRDNLLVLSEISRLRKDFRSAYEYYKEYSEIDNEMFNQESMIRVAHLQNEYENEKKEKEIQLLKKDKKIYIGLFASIVVIILLVLWNRRRMIKMEERLTHEAKLNAFFNHCKFSEREREVAVMVLQGLENREIEDRLFISIGTVKNHILNIFRKAGVNTRGNFIIKVRDFDYKSVIDPDG